MSGSVEDLRHVLVHELEHLNTNHPLQLFLQHVAQVICWFHPAVWSASWNASMAREFSCDDAVAAQGSNCAAYLRTLLHIAERGEHTRQTTGIAFGRAPSELVLRAQRLVNAATKPRVGRRTAVFGRKTAMCMLLCAASLMAVMTIPVDALSSSRSVWSPWPRWTAEMAHCFGHELRDYEIFDRRVQLYELRLDRTTQADLQQGLLWGD
jgi:beta-lactamase regulating signal transducer with metallopeptidase domain